MKHVHDSLPQNVDRTEVATSAFFGQGLETVCKDFQVGWKNAKSFRPATTANLLIWKERNEAVFRGKTSGSEVLIRIVMALTKEQFKLKEGDIFNILKKPIVVDYQPILVDCKLMLKEFEEVHISHVFGEGHKA